MDLSFITQKVTEGEVSLFTFILALSIAVAVVFFLLAIIWRLSKKIKVLSKMRYGFGGKPLFSILTLLFLTLAIPLTLFAAQKSIDYVNVARADKDVLVEIYSDKVNENLYEVSMLAIPFVDDVAWAGKSYTMDWSITGEVHINRKEEERDSDNLSYITEELPSGSYKIKVVVQSEDFKVIRSQELELD
jgi:energy-coupling factor transporter transmembrane protein EcfT